MTSLKQKAHLERLRQINTGSRRGGWNKGIPMTKEQKKKISLAHKAKNLVGRRSRRWKGGRRLVDGYIYIYSPNHPNRTKGRAVCEHRLVMEKHLGRLLARHEVVHHINGIRTDNRIENLVLCQSTGKHAVENHVKRDIKGKFC